jgi:predicted Fe-Mo cluster-binding NifX family protein
MKIAITTWNERISPVYDSSGTLLVYLIDNRVVTAKAYLPFPSTSIEEKAAFLVSHNIDILICGAITNTAKEKLHRHNIEVYSFIAGSTDDVVRGWRNGRLNNSCFAMPGCSCRYRHGRRSGSDPALSKIEGGQHIEENQGGNYAGI